MVLPSTVGTDGLVAASDQLLVDRGFTGTRQALHQIVPFSHARRRALSPDQKKFDTDRLRGGHPRTYPDSRTFPNMRPETRPEVRESRPCPKHSSRTSDRGSRPSPRAGSSSTCATPSGGSRRAGARGAPSRTSTAARRSSSPSSGSTSPSWSPGRPASTTPRRTRRRSSSFQGSARCCRGRGATPAALGLLPLFPVDRARLRGRGRGAVCDPDGRFALGPGRALPGIGARGALRRERGGGDLRLEAGVREVERFRRERPPNWARLPWA